MTEETTEGILPLEVTALRGSKSLLLHHAAFDARCLSGCQDKLPLEMHVVTGAQLRLVRLLLDMTQSDLARVADVSRATINRYESGVPVGAGQVRLMKMAIEAAGGLIIPDGAIVEGLAVYGGVGLRSPRVSIPSIIDNEPADS